jgi:hypothetical protein
MKRSQFSVKIRRTLSWVILLFLTALFSIKFTAKTITKKANDEKLNFIEKWLLAIDENVVVNPYHIFKYIYSYKDIGRPPQKRIPKDATICIGKDSISINKKYLYSYYSGNNNSYIVKLLDLSTNNVLHTWKLPYNKARKIYMDWNKNLIQSDFDNHLGFSLNYNKKVRLRVPTLLENKKIVVRLQGLLLCLDKKSNIKWYQNKFFHHSMEVDAKGNLWVASYHDTSKNTPYLADQIVKLNSKDGSVLFKKNIGEIFRKNPNHDLSKIRLDNEDLYHLNDIQPIYRNSKYWKKGDLFISLLGVNTVILYRPKTNEIIWRKMTNWSNQHDVNVVNDSLITIFDNNLKRKRPELKVKKQNRLIQYNFAKDTIKSLFQDVFEKNNIKTPTQGKAKYFPKDSLLYVESTTQSFFVIHDFKKDKSFKCYIQGRSKKQASNLGWFRLLK